MYLYMKKKQNFIPFIYTGGITNGLVFVGHSYYINIYKILYKTLEHL